MEEIVRYEGIINDYGYINIFDRETNKMIYSVDSVINLLNQQEKRFKELQTKYDNLHTALNRIREIVPETVKILLSRIDKE